MRIKKKKLFRLISILIVISSLFLDSCEPPLCAWCYDNNPLSWGRDIEICAKDQGELDDLVRVSEAMGYDCEYKERGAVE